jgi:hypothetical protein
MSFIRKFLDYNCGTECPVNFLRWSALSTLAVAASKRYFFKQGRNIVYPTEAIILVGSQGSRKSYAKDQARELIADALPTYPMGAAMQSREDIVKVMAAEGAQRSFTNHEGAATPFTPLAFFINELKNFLSYNPSGMIEFITDIWDRRTFDASTIKRGLEKIELPVLNFLACETPDWIMDKLKLRIISGGFSRRFNFVYELDDDTIIIPEPYLPPNADDLWSDMVKHIQKVASNAKKYEWEPSGEARRFFHQWYKENKSRRRDADPMMKGFLSTKDQQLLRICILLDLDRSSPEYLITKPIVELSIDFFNSIERNLPKLFVASGRNELAIPIAKMMDALEEAGGWLPTKRFSFLMSRDFTPIEQTMVERYLRDNDRILQKTVKFPSGFNKDLTMTREFYDDWQRSGALEERVKGNGR